MRASNLRHRVARLANLGLDRTLRRRRSVRSIAKTFHRTYYELAGKGGTWRDTRWFGIETLKCPLDMWVMQEMIDEVRPDLIVEIGTHRGGSALFFAHMCDVVGTGEILTIDIAEQPNRPTHPRIAYVKGPSLDPAIIDQVEQRVAEGSTVMVVLDGDHNADHVLTELRTYGRFVTPGSYLVAEDTNVNGRPVLPKHGPGPGEAVDAFLSETDEFEVDRSREKFLLTFNPGGYLRRRG